MKRSRQNSNTQNLLNLLNEYSFNKQNIENIFHKYSGDTNMKKTKYDNISVKTKIKKEKTNSINDDFTIPVEDDTVFWCWLIFTKGLSNYTIVRDRAFVTIKTEKINFVEKVRKYKKILKKYKIKLCDIESNLSMGKKLDIIFLEPMLIMENYNFIYMDDKIYYENIIDEDNKTCVIKYFKDSEKYGLFLNDISKIKKNKLFIVDNLSKPIKAISNYKADEIREICKKLDINIMKSPTKYKTKKILYQLIKEKLN